MSLRQTAGRASLLAAIAFTGSIAFAQDNPRPLVRAEISPTTVNVGERAELTITVAVPTWFPRPSLYPSFELPNAIVRLPPDSSYPSTQRVNGESWASIVRTYEFYPLLGATYVLDKQFITVTYASPPGPNLIAEVPVPEVTLTAIVPAGAESIDPYLAGSSVTLERTLDRAVDELAVGDAIVAEYVLRVDGLPTLFLPPIVSPDSVPGLSIYPDQPRLEDDDGVSQRTEKLTFVLEAGGAYLLPAAEFRWWNTATGTVETARVEAQSFDVAGAPLEAPAEATVEPFDWRRLVLPFLSLVAAIWLLSKLVPPYLAGRRARREAWLASEAHAFEAVNRASRGRDLHATYAAIRHWLDRIDARSDLRSFAHQHGSDRLARQIDEMQQALYADGAPPDLGQMVRELDAARQARLYGEAAGRSALPALNP